MKKKKKIKVAVFFTDGISCMENSFSFHLLGKKFRSMYLKTKFTRNDIERNIIRDNIREKVCLQV